MGVGPTRKSRTGADKRSVIYACSRKYEKHPLIFQQLSCFKLILV